MTRSLARFATLERYERMRGDVIDGSAQTGREGGEINDGCCEGAGETRFGRGGWGGGQEGSRDEDCGYEGYGYEDCGHEDCGH
jgi:hypothetical protein